jgi:regulator of sigma D
MGTIGAIATAVGVGLQIVDKYIDDPTRRLKARQEMIDGIKEKMNETLTAQDLEELDKSLLDFVSSLHNL